MAQWAVDEKKLEKPCQWCGSNKPTSTTRVFDTKVFCSKECVHNYKITNNLIEGRPRKLPTAEELFALQRKHDLRSRIVEAEAGFYVSYLSQIFNGKIKNVKPEKIKAWKEAIDSLLAKKQKASIEVEVVEETVAGGEELTIEVKLSKGDKELTVEQLARICDVIEGSVVYCIKDNKIFICTEKPTGNKDK